MAPFRWMRACVSTFAAALGSPLCRLLRLARAALAAALLAALGIAAPSLAQSMTPPPIFPAVDGNGVNVVTGTFNAGSTDVVIGQPGAGGLSFSWQYDASSGQLRHNWHGYVAMTSYPTYMVVVGSHAESFTVSYPGYPDPPTYAPDQATGSTLTQGTGSWGAEYIYKTADGVTYTFAWVGLTSVTYPSGEVITLHHAAGGYSVYEEWPCYCWHDENYSRLQAVTNNFGYQLHLEYASDTVTYYSNPYITGYVPDAGWDTFVRVRGINMAVDWCDPTVGTCSGFTESWPVATYAGGWQPTSVTDSLSRTTSYSYSFIASASRITEVQFPDHADHDVGVAYYTSGAHAGRVSSVDRGYGTWTYAYADASGVRTTTITDPDSKVTTVKSTIATGRITEVKDPLNRITAYQYDGANRLTRVTAPEGNYTQYTYDNRGNVTETRTYDKAGSTYIAATATYPGSCTYPVTCNMPTTTTDARGQVTNYYYDNTHGGVTSILAPASGSGTYGSIRAETRFSYATRTARYYVAPGNTDPGPPIWRLIETSACATSASCDGGADETVTTITYPAAGTPNNLLPVSVTTAAGNGAVSTTTATTYTPQGDVKTVDGPLSGSADTTRFYYDAARQLSGVIGPDPDGGGALKYRAVRTTFNTVGLPTIVERGTTTNQGDTAFSTFALLEKQDTIYDSYARPVQSRLWNGGSIVALTQMNYDVVGRPKCAAQRMNSSEFSSPPSDACDDAPSGAEADRITRTSYTNAGQVASVQSGYDTGLAQTTIEYAYTTNGLVDYYDDASNNRTNLTYDGFDRLVQTNYPVTTVGQETANGSDYEQITYDAYGRVSSTRRRDGQTFALSYDNLGRTTLVNAPGSDPDVTTAYDLLGRATSVSQSGNTITNSYDQLSRLISSASSVLGTVSYQYDAAGRRTRLTWPNSAYVTYAYNTASDLTGILESGSTSLASFAYDDLGRRTSLTRGNGVVTSYTFDAVSRLATLVQNASGTSHDNTWSFSYNPASQITSRTRTNSVFDWTTSGSSGTSTVNYSDNGLDQYTSVGGVTPSYDARGNLTGDGTKTYGYDARNRLTSASGGVTLSYDPLGRLHQVAGGATTRFLYDGADAIAEYDGSNTLLRRYVHGPGLDEPIVWYEGSGTSDKRYLMADERGSVVAVTNASGTVTNVNTYDAFGQPGSSNTGRFQYTGQMWLAEAGLYHYKARAYHPGLGRFLQTDPIGVAGGMNLYGYVGNDPVNGSDPSGLVRTETFTYCTADGSYRSDGRCDPMPAVNPHGIAWPYVGQGDWYPGGAAGADLGGYAGGAVPGAGAGATQRNDAVPTPNSCNSSATTGQGMIDDAVDFAVRAEFLPPEYASNSLFQAAQFINTYAYKDWSLDRQSYTIKTTNNRLLSDTGGITDPLTGQIIVYRGGIEIGSQLYFIEAVRMIGHEASHLYDLLNANRPSYPSPQWDANENRAQQWGADLVEMCTAANLSSGGT